MTFRVLGNYWLSNTNLHLTLIGLFSVVSGRGIKTIVTEAAWIGLGMVCKTYISTRIWWASGLRGN